MMVDAHVLPTTYAEWLRKAEAQEAKHKAAGLHMIRITIDPDTFPAWCSKNGLQPDAKARVAFATDGVTEQVRRTH